MQDTELSQLAKKYLSVQASSAACERIFFIAGHIFSLKRRRLCHGLFSDLIFLKLNFIMILKLIAYYETIIVYYIFHVIIFH